MTWSDLRCDDDDGAGGPPRPQARRHDAGDPDEDSSEDDGGDHDLCCSVCGRRITGAQHAIEHGGAHAHTFANPGGFVHHVRCFGYAGGVAEQGDPETYFSWFPGYAWQVLACGGCGVHIGWSFRCADDVFYGLIAERLVERRAD
ncbi:MAG: hypothetical protein H6709_03745 [Kofleriaceae bacterium]|nr:hypothetical protein [Myxococcales bacterium]MCB9560252.1 hypothetical protein [Kofleriaceae bacterium]MCB9571183.1 hypothetical protein [Kofleriaceae bacterium]